MSLQILIQDIIANFQKQEQLYLTIAELSVEQLGILENEDWLNKPDHLNDLLAKRQDLNHQIDRLNIDNKLLQSKVNQQLAISEFVLSKLKAGLDDEQFISLSQIVIGLGNILAKINQVDEQSHLLIKRKAGITRATIQSNSQHVKKAYQEAMQQTRKPSQ